MQPREGGVQLAAAGCVWVALPLPPAGAHRAAACLSCPRRAPPQVVGVLKKEAMKTQSRELEKGAEYRQMLVQVRGGGAWGGGGVARQQLAAPSRVCHTRAGAHDLNSCFPPPTLLTPAGHPHVRGAVPRRGRQRAAPAVRLPVRHQHRLRAGRHLLHPRDHPGGWWVGGCGRAGGSVSARESLGAQAACPGAEAQHMPARQRCRAARRPAAAAPAPRRPTRACTTRSWSA